VFVSLTDPTQPISEYTVGAQVTALKEAIGAHAESGLHLLRHTFLTKAGDNIKNVKTLMLIAGHNNPAASMRYIHPAGDDIADALASCDGVSPQSEMCHAAELAVSAL
jgi:integrase